MGWNNNYGYSRNDYNNRGYSRNYQQAPYNPNYRQAPSYAPQPRKKSGAKLTIGQDGAVLISGWRVNSNKHLIKVYARPYKNTHEFVNKKGQTGLTLFCEITNMTTCQVTKTTMLWNDSTKKGYIPDYNLVVSPNANNGGYFGKCVSKNYRR